MAASNYSAILTAVKAILTANSDVGAVYDYEPLAGDWQTFILAMRDPTDTDVINGWTISRSGFTEKAETNEEHERAHEFTISGFYGLTGAGTSEKTFNAVVEDLCDDFRATANMTLGGTADRIDAPTGGVIQKRSFGSVLCHVATFKLTVYETIKRN